jgi:predicted TIM-barrel fold metal-dependent hydrolase
MAITTLEDPLMRDIGVTLFRKPQTPGPNALLNGEGIISADSHWEVTEDIFYEGFPVHLREKAPRVWFDRAWRLGFPPSKLTEHSIRSLELAFTSGLHDLDVRLEHVLGEGVSQEIVFPQNVMSMRGAPDVEVREWTFRVYNEWVARQSAKIPGRFHGVGVISNWWDPGRAEAAVRQIADLGLKAMLLPTSPPNNPDGSEYNFASEENERLMAVVAETGIPLTFHIGENFNLEGRGKHASFLLNLISPFRKPFGQLAFGGVFDRNPTLKVVFTEAGINWVPCALQDAEMLYDSYDVMFEPRPKHRPSHYWQEHCYATFQNDRLGLHLLEYIGVDNVMWASDYPHPEGSFGYDYSSRQVVLDATSDEVTRKILGGTAKKVFHL